MYIHPAQETQAVDLVGIEWYCKLPRPICRHRGILGAGIFVQLATEIPF